MRGRALAHAGTRTEGRATGAKLQEIGREAREAGEEVGWRALCGSCGDVFDADGGNEMALARGGEHHTRASR